MEEIDFYKIIDDDDGMNKYNIKPVSVIWSGIAMLIFPSWKLSPVSGRVTIQKYSPASSFVTNWKYSFPSLDTNEYHLTLGRMKLWKVSLNHAYDRTKKIKLFKIHKLAIEKNYEYSISQNSANNFQRDHTSPVYPVLGGKHSIPIPVNEVATTASRWDLGKSFRSVKQSK